MQAREPMWIAIVGAATVVSLTVGTVVPASAAEGSMHITNSVMQDVSISSMPAMTDAQLDDLLRRLESVPVDLKWADPRTTPNYAHRLDDALNGTVVNNGVQPYFNLPGCAYEIGLLVVQYGVPVGKVIGWIKSARKLYGGVKGIWRAMRNGMFMAQMGSEAQKIFEMILGIDGVMRQCFS